MLMVIKKTNKQKTVSYNQIVPGSESLEITPRFSIKLCEKMATDSECQFLSMIPLFYVPQQLKTRQVNFPYFVQCMLKSHSSCSVRPVISLHATAAFWQSIRNTGTRYWLLNVFFIILYKNIVNIDLRLFHLHFLSAEIANSVPASKPQQTQFSCLMAKQRSMWVTALTESYTGLSGVSLPNCTICQMWCVRASLEYDHEKLVASWTLLSIIQLRLLVFIQDMMTVA